MKVKILYFLELNSLTICDAKWGDIRAFRLLLELQDQFINIYILTTTCCGKFLGKHTKTILLELKGAPIVTLEYIFRVITDILTVISWTLIKHHFLSPELIWLVKNLLEEEKLPYNTPH